MAYQFSYNSCPEINNSEFARISEYLYRHSRITMGHSKKLLVQTRLAKRLHDLGLETFEEYIALLDKDVDGEEMSSMVNLLSTHTTHFFREPAHFDFLIENVLKPNPNERRRNLKIWSAGCSTGEEAYTIAMLMREYLDAITLSDSYVIGTDVAINVLGTAMNGVYHPDALAKAPEAFKTKYAEHVIVNGQAHYKMKKEIAARTKFWHLNLFEPWPLKDKFDVIFCRNVMIYMDAHDQETLIRRYAEQLKPGGYLMLGSSERISRSNPDFEFAQPSIYRKR